MAFGDILRTATFTGDDIADLIEGIGSSSHPLAWTTWSPTYSASGSMTFTSVTTNYAKYLRIGKLIIFAIKATGTTGGTPDTTLQFTLPVTASSDAVTGNSPFSAFTNDSSTVGGFGFVSSSTVGGVRKYDATNYASGASRQIFCAGAYEAA